MIKYCKTMIKTILFHYKVFYFLQAVLKYIPFRAFSKIRAFVYRPFFMKIGTGVNIHDNIVFKFPRDIMIGNNVQIASQTIIVGGGGLFIGDDVMIGAGAVIITSSHNFESTVKPMRQQGLSYKSICIERDVWLGTHCAILGGTTIAQGCIIGANSVVTKSIDEQFMICGGNPAVMIKSRKQ